MQAAHLPQHMQLVCRALQLDLARGCELPWRAADEVQCCIRQLDAVGAGSLIHVQQQLHIIAKQAAGHSTAQRSTARSNMGGVVVRRHWQAGTSG
jgi:hypothetical protein